MKKFNVEGKCYSEIHYMADISDRIARIKDMVDDNQYFCINRGRQYGKTTTLSILKKTLEKEYVVFLLSFEALGKSNFDTEDHLIRSFLQLLETSASLHEVNHISEDFLLELKKAMNRTEWDMLSFSLFISKLCNVSKKKIVLMIDEVDQASEYDSFLKFLGVIRDKFLNRMERPTFQSVILASVYDIKSLKLKVRPEESHQYNSPWNIASSFDVDMNLSIDEIKSMLDEYEKEHQIGLNTEEFSKLLFEYTSGYPVLVSSLCKIMDERQKQWNQESLGVAIKCLYEEGTPLFESLVNKLEQFPKLRSLIHDLLFKGTTITYNIDQESIKESLMFGFTKKDGSNLVIANRIFETRLYNLFLTSEEAQRTEMYQQALINKPEFIQGQKLDMELILSKFVTYYEEIYGSHPEKFTEDEGRRLFLLYLRPIINGVGNYYIESQTRNMERTDVIIDYLGQRYVLELKIWRGEAYNLRGEKQLSDYLDYYHLQEGYMLSFNFNKKKRIGVQSVLVDSRKIIEAVC